MYTVTLETGFRACHGLKYAMGDTEPVHWHDWVVRTAVESEQLDKNGLALDFVYLKEKVDAVTDGLDNNELEKLNCFAGINASAENVARYIFGKLESQIPKPAKLLSIEVMEAPGCWAKFSR